MSKAAQSLKEKIHERIEGIDDEKVLEAFYVILDNHKNEAEDYELTDEQMKELEMREAEHLSGKDKGYNLEEFIATTKKRYGFK
jgi:putative addiction module component (TIGR02574 family)